MSAAQERLALALAERLPGALRESLGATGPWASAAFVTVERAPGVRRYACFALGPDNVPRRVYPRHAVTADLSRLVRLMAPRPAALVLRVASDGDRDLDGLTCLYGADATPWRSLTDAALAALLWPDARPFPSPAPAVEQVRTP